MVTRSVRDGLKVGDRVAYASEFLRNTGQHGYAADMRGTVASVVAPVRDDLVYLMVQWDGEDEPRGCLSCNLWPADKLHLEPR